MSNILTLLTDLQISKSTKFSFIENDVFPTGPKVGQLTFVDGVLYIYSVIKNIETWYPLTSAKKVYVHTQITPSALWTIIHNLDSVIFTFITYNNIGEIISTVTSNITSNSFQLSLGVADTGKTIVFVDQDYNQSQTQIVFSDLLNYDGSGSNFDADLLDGQHGSYYLNASNINSGTLNSSLLNSIITPDTYTKVTVNDKGLVITGGLLSSSDITTALGYIPAAGSANSTISILEDSIRIGDLNRLSPGTTTLDFVSTVNPSDNYDARLEVIGQTLNIKSDKLTFNGDDIWYCNDGDISSQSFINSGTSQFTADSYDITHYYAVEIFLLIKYNNDIHSTKILLSNNGTNAYITEYGSITSNGNLASVDADISNGQMRLLLTPFNNSIIKLIRVGIKT